MTAQFGDRIFFGNIKYSISSEPLSCYLENLKDKPKFIPPNTALWRGYRCNWQVIDNKLHLIDITAWIDGNKELGMDYFFPGQSKVFAVWYTGDIRIQTGELLEYYHGGYGSTYEEDWFLEFRNGVYINMRVVKNELKEPTDHDDDIPF
jgi:hypothetical protein